MTTNLQLIQKAKQIAKPHHINKDIATGEVGSALLTNKKNVYIGVSLHMYCGIGFCAEHSAIASMVTNQEFVIEKIVAVSSKGNILPPCGRCRELILQINKKNLNTEVIIGKNKTVKLKELLPYRWEKTQ